MKMMKFFDGKYYQGSLEDAQCVALRSLFEEYTSVSALRHVIKDVPPHLITDIKSLASTYEKENGSLKGFQTDILNDVGVGTLLDAQTIGVAFMYYAGSMLLGDEVGLGKTVQIAGLANVLSKEYAGRGKKFRYLFLAEKSTVGQIQDKMIQFTGEYVGMVESGETRFVEQFMERNKDELHYSLVGTHGLVNNPLFLTYAAKNPFDLIVFDESWALKNASSGMYKNCKSLFNLHKRKILLNATPVETSIRDLYDQLALLDKDYLPTVGEFNNRYVKKSYSHFGGFAAGGRGKESGFKNEAEFKEAIRLRYLARTRIGLGAEYRENIYKCILVPMSAEQKRLKSKTSLHQMLADYPPGIDHRVPFNRTTTPKLDVLAKIAHDAVKVNGGQMLVYSRFIEAQKGIAEELTNLGFRCIVINGQRETSSAKKRAEILTDFNNGKYEIIITNIQRGLDLKTCDTCVLYTIDPNPQKMVQFEGRMTRDFNIEYKSVYLLVAMGKEKKMVEEKLKLRVQASDAFSVTGNSMVLQAIKSDENKEFYEQKTLDEDLN